MSRRLSLAGQLLALQVVIISVVLVGVAAVTVAQSTLRASEYERSRAEEVAETLAAARAFRATLDGEGLRPSEAAVRYFRTTAETSRKTAGSESVVVGTADGTVLASADPPERGTVRDRGESTVLEGRGWTGVR